MRIRNKVAVLILSLLLTGCAQEELYVWEKEAKNGFNALKWMDTLSDISDKCEFYSVAKYPFVNDLWKSKRDSEVVKYSWMEFSDTSDFYEIVKEYQSAYQVDNDARVENTQECIDYLQYYIGGLEWFSQNEAADLNVKLKALFNNRKLYLLSALEMKNLPITEKNRSKYLELEDQIRSLNDEKDSLFYSIRAQIDFVELTNTPIRVYIEKCPTAFSINILEVQNYRDDGSVLLVNDSDSSETISFRVQFINEGIIVGDDRVSETVPAKSKSRVKISALGSSEEVTGGTSFPLKCSVA